MTTAELLVKATPRPWRWVETEDGQCRLLGGDNFVVAMFNTKEPGSEEQQATAVLIKTAVNTFEPLVKVLERIWAAAEDADDAFVSSLAQNALALMRKEAEDG